LRKQFIINNLKKAKPDLVLPFSFFCKKSVGAKEILRTFAARFKGILQKNNK